MIISDLTSGAAGFFAGVRTGLRLMTRHERMVAMALAVTTIVNGMLQTLVIVGIVPFVLAIVDPSKAVAGRILGWVRPLFGTQAQQTVLLELAAGLTVLFVAGWLQLGWLSRFSARCEARLSSMMIQRVIMAPYAWLLGQNTVRLREIILGSIVHWSRDFIRMLMQLINDLVFAGFLIVALIFAGPIAGMLVTSTGVLLAAITFIAVRPKLVQFAAMKKHGIINASIISMEAFAGVKDVKMAAAEGYFSLLFRKQVMIYSNFDASAQQWKQLPRLVIDGIACGALIGVSVIVILLGSDTGDIGGLLVLYGLAAIRLLPTLNTIVSALGTVVSSFPFISELERLIAETASSEHSSKGNAYFVLWKRVDLDNVSYSYRDADRPALTGVSLCVERGASYGVVGPSGAGKSTLIDLVAGLLEPTDGAIRVDGRPLLAERRLEWRRRFGYVAQRPFLIDASLRENILFGADRVDVDRLAKAITLARLDGLVAQIPRGLDSPVGDRGIALSGGQQQRVAIARALYRGADVLILDEATSALDALVERELADSLERLRGEVTTIIVSHRLGLVRGCNEIWLLEDARLSARGTHALLLSSSDLYRRMIEAQSDTRLPVQEERDSVVLVRPVLVEDLPGSMRF